MGSSSNPLPENDEDGKEESVIIMEEAAAAASTMPPPPSIRSISSDVVVDEALLLRHSQRAGLSHRSGSSSHNSGSHHNRDNNNNSGQGADGNPNDDDDNGDNNPSNKKHTQELQRIFQDSRVRTQHSVPHVKPRPPLRPSIVQKRWKKIKKSPPEHYVKRFVPLYASLKTYNLAKFRNDVIAGITVSVMAIPLGISYATSLAGLPPVFGLYGSCVPAMVYPIFGTTHQLAVGPAALLSLLVQEGIKTFMEKHHEELLDDKESIEYKAITTGLAIKCTFMVAILNLAMGLFRLGFLTQFLSRAVISGFLSGAAIVITFSQLRHILGIVFDAPNQIHVIIYKLIQNIDDLKWRPLILGCSCIGILVAAKEIALNPKIRAKFPLIKWIRASSPIAVSILGIVLVHTLDLDKDKKIAVVGEIKAGLSDIISVSDWFPMEHELWPVIISMVVVGFVQSIAISKRIGYRRGYEVDPSQELVALGMANLVGGMFSAYPTAGAIGQTAVNDEIGAETGIASVVTGLVVLVVLWQLTPVFELMPKTVLAAIVISFVLSMFDYPEAIYLYKVHKFDCAVWVIAFLGTTFLGVKEGLAIAVIISLLIVVWESAYPHTAVLGRLPGTTVYRDVVQYAEAERYDGLVIVRVDAPIYFANSAHVRDVIQRYKRRAAQDFENPDSAMEFIIMDFSPVSRIDTTGLHMLTDLYTAQKEQKTQLCVCNPSIEVLDRLTRSGLADKIGRQHIFSSVIDAVQWCLNDMDTRAADSGVEHP